MNPLDEESAVTRRIRKVPSSNLCRKTSCSYRRFRRFPASSHVNSGTVSKFCHYCINKIQQDATDAGIYLLQNYSTCFGCLSHPPSGVHKTVTAASGTGYSVRATTFCQRGVATLAEERCPDT